MSSDQLKFVKPIRHCFDGHLELFVQRDNTIAREVPRTTSECEALSRESGFVRRRRAGSFGSSQNATASLTSMGTLQKVPTTRRCNKFSGMTKLAAKRSMLRSTKSRICSLGASIARSRNATVGGSSTMWPSSCAPVNLADVDPNLSETVILFRLGSTMPAIADFVVGGQSKISGTDTYVYPRSWAVTLGSSRSTGSRGTPHGHKACLFSQIER